MTPHVGFQVRLSEKLPTNSTFDLPLTVSVLPLVVVPLLGNRESSLANVALEWLISNVTPLVYNT